ncbi:MAG TPA: glycerophosphodiester phosphodiesterase family protein [Candidatus Binataceae bacterium]
MNIAHRGASGAFPENTLAAFLAAIEAGAAMCELDVQLTIDGAVVVIHDDTVDRTTDGSGEVAAMTLAQIKRLDAAAKFKSGAHPGERIPTLDEVFAAVAGRCGINVELKAGGLERKVAEIMRVRDVIANSMVSSFEWEWLRTMRAIAPEIRIGLLAEENPTQLLMNAVSMRAHAINPRSDMVNAALCDAAHQRGLKLYTWTVDNPDKMRALIADGVDGIMTNYPERLQTVLSG